MSAAVATASAFATRVFLFAGLLHGPHARRVSRLVLVVTHRALLEKGS
jgi:hypothetical protein